MVVYFAENGPITKPPYEIKVAWLELHLTISQKYIIGNNNWLYIFAWMTINKTVHKTYKIYGSQSPHRHFWWKEHLLYFSCWCKKRETFFSIYLEKRSFFSQFFVVRKAKLFYKLITRYFRRLMADNLSSSWEKEKNRKEPKDSQF